MKSSFVKTQPQPAADPYCYQVGFAERQPISGLTRAFAWSVQLVTGGPVRPSLRHDDRDPGAIVEVA